MKKNMTVEQMMQKLDEDKRRLEVFASILEKIDYEINFKCKCVILEDGYYEKYTDEDGNERSKYHMPVYQTDENGDEVRIPPSEGDWNYEEYIAWCKVRDEIFAMI